MTTWTPVTPQAETWTSEDPALRPFSPESPIVGMVGFSLSPAFSTGSSVGIWAPKTEQSETWTAA